MQKERCSLLSMSAQHERKGLVESDCIMSCSLSLVLTLSSLFCVWKYRYRLGGPGMQIITYSTPTSPGQSRLFYCLIADKHAAPKAMKRAIELKPDWLLFLNHFERNLVLDGDGVFLHGQVSCTVPDTDRAAHASSSFSKYVFGLNKIVCSDLARSVLCYLLALLACIPEQGIQSMVHLQQLKHAALTVLSILMLGMPASDLLLECKLVHPSHGSSSAASQHSARLYTYHCISKLVKSCLWVCLFCRIVKCNRGPKA